MIRLEGISARVGGFALHDVSFEVPASKYGVVIGPAGSGKTTLLETIAGVVPSIRGRITVSQRDVGGLAVSERGIGLVYQHAYLFPHLSVSDNVAYGERDGGTAAEMMRLFGVDALSDRHVNSLSGGERQLVALARALAQRPSVLLLDEPFSALDPKRRSLTRRHVRDLHRAWGFTVLQVTHDFAEAGLLGDVAVLLDDGRVLQSGPAAEVFRHPASPYIAEFLGAENVLAGVAQAGSVDGVTEDDWESPRGGAQRAIDFVSGPVVIHAMGDVEDGPCHAVIRAEEIILSRGAQASSARNRFTGVVSEVVNLGGYARVAIDVQGVPFVALLTIPSVHELGLAPGVEAHVSFKAFAVHLC